MRVFSERMDMWHPTISTAQISLVHIRKVSFIHGACGQLFTPFSDQSLVYHPLSKLLPI